ncbi:sulfite exporter TauE/SafE family protein [Tenacibaculum finnmarkense]|uniref:sulfite exporter TauE/SafE family protein n=1 Tax=Tenacibaculum finnmarkense TaxID=2781243 RepID=UPI000C6B4479|nr:sulfite exporter TauE/SafE family protein [Tenacibaculum finnmarkense]MCD8440533.1 sulfite exporter TauE/SafE family protein [Tenacibaculum finnmarkense genomovar ulcerans]MCG8721432.1 sulfite exporter TauE/SafE family protein [Tenacibaculum finnmarkense]SOS55300.1 putative membrane transporter protein [Tenacibaculum finnmarkense]
MIPLLETFFLNWQLLLLFFSIAILYASVGFGGGSSYLAVLVLTGIAYSQIRATSLLCNIVVVFSNVVFFQKEKLIHWKKISPLVFCSVPMAFLGGFIKINQTVFFIILGITLFIASLIMWFSNTTNYKKQYKTSNYKNASYGAAIGFISGMIGIGGGIFLAPLLHLTHWDTPKKIAATASVFILVNSISGLIGQSLNASFAIDWHLTSLLLISVAIGGQIGQRSSHKLLNPMQLKKATAILIAFVSIRILIKYLF